MYIRFNNTNDSSTIDLTMSNLIDLYSEIEVTGSIANIAEEYNVIIGCKPNAFKTLTDKIAEEYGLVLSSPSDITFTVYNIQNGEKSAMNIKQLEEKVAAYYEAYNANVRMNDNLPEDLIELDFTPAVMAEIAYHELAYVTPLLPNNLISIYNDINNASTRFDRFCAMLAASKYTQNEYGWDFELAVCELKKDHIKFQGNYLTVGNAVGWAGLSDSKFIEVDSVLVHGMKKAAMHV